MVFLLFIGSVITLELILGANSRTPAKDGDSRLRTQEQEGSRAQGLVALMQAVNGQSAPVSPALPAIHSEQATNSQQNVKV